MKVERVSYDVITPSAARGILEAIYWKPQIRFVIDRIHVLKPIRFTNIRRSEKRPPPLPRLHASSLKMLASNASPSSEAIICVMDGGFYPFALRTFRSDFQSFLMLRQIRFNQL